MTSITARVLTTRAVLAIATPTIRHRSARPRPNVPPFLKPVKCFVDATIERTAAAAVVARVERLFEDTVALLAK